MYTRSNSGWRHLLMAVQAAARFLEWLTKAWSMETKAKCCCQLTILPPLSSISPPESSHIFLMNYFLVKSFQLPFDPVSALAFHLSCNYLFPTTHFEPVSFNLFTGAFEMPLSPQFKKGNPLTHLPSPNYHPLHLLPPNSWNMLLTSDSSTCLLQFSTLPASVWLPSRC